ncbi:hypothetical protein AVEN_98715-1 [Araneus ventricosus]|uniref:DUF4817 domain-containing protein n=1 Tax=Araneus ventricosus TaxID=182803 RepID=A0A4Y2HGV9_ARAVE|nr:hypothetical protein AVEN_98715-1 [Araneus ventricosus]
MAFAEQKAVCVLSFARCGSVIIVQREFCKKYRINPPTAQSIGRWYHQFESSGCLRKGKSGDNQAYLRKMLKECETLFEEAQSYYCLRPVEKWAFLSLLFGEC